MEIRRTLSALALATSLTGCGDKTTVAPTPQCPSTDQVESDFQGPFMAGGRRFEPTSHRGEWKMTYAGQATLLGTGSSVDFRAPQIHLTEPSDTLIFRVLAEATGFDSSARVITTCVPRALSETSH